MTADLLAPRPLSRAAIIYLVQRARGDNGPVLIPGVAGRQYGVRKQAVHAAWRKLYPGVKPPGRAGRPRSADARTHDVGAGRFRLRASSAELAAYQRGAGDRPLGTWLAEIAGGRRIKTARLRRLARAAAGMPEE